jgi:hypothetical protein
MQVIVEEILYHFLWVEAQGKGEIEWWVVYEPEEGHSYQVDQGSDTKYQPACTNTETSPSFTYLANIACGMIEVLENSSRNSQHLNIPSCY